MLQIPELIQLVLIFVQEAMVQGFRLDPLEQGEFSKPAFRADAKADANDVMIGGRAPDKTNATKKLVCFSEKITRQNSPWAFSKGEAFRTIASLELFASPLSVIAFVPMMQEGRESSLALAGDKDI